MKQSIEKMLGLGQTGIVGLDIGSSSVKLVQLHNSNGHWTVTAADIVKIANTSKHDKDCAEPNISKAIGDYIESTGVQRQFAVCGVSGQEVAVRNFSFPYLPQEKIKNAVYLEAMQVCPFNIDDASFDYQLINDGENNINGVFAAATNRIIEKKSQFAKEAGFQTALMDVDGLALLNCFHKSQETEVRQPTAILNVGYSYTNLVIMDNEDLSFVRDIPYAGEAIVNKIAGENNVSAETVKRTLLNCENQPKFESELAAGLFEACQKLVCDITETLRYYTTQKRDASIEKIFVCGGFAMVNGFVEVLDEQLPKQVVLWNPFENLCYNINKGNNKVTYEDGPSLAVAIGLAMRSM